MVKVLWRQFVKSSSYKSRHHGLRKVTINLIDSSKLGNEGLGGKAEFATESGDAICKP